MKKIYTFLSSVLSLSLLTSSATAQGVPELMYYRFDSSAAFQTNYASSPVGVNPTHIAGLVVNSTGQFGTALVGNGGTSDVNVADNGWATNLGTGAWTISMWVNNLPATVATSNYFFGDAGASFRCFTGGVAGNNNIMLRGTNMTDVVVANIGAGPVVIHFVHEVTPANVIKVYRNGVLSGTVAQATVANIVGTGFKIGGYSAVSGLPAGCLMDEFRMYNRALSATEVGSTWNTILGNVPLSVKDMAFAAVSRGDVVELSWQNEGDERVKEYVVERSGNGSSFELMETIAHERNRTKYKLTDPNAFTASENGVVYFRLRADGVNGKVEYSDVKKVVIDKRAPLVKVYPNPFDEEVTVSANVSKASTISITMVDVVGRVVRSEQGTLAPGENLRKLSNAGLLPKGTYKVTVSVEGEVYSETLMK